MENWFDKHKFFEKLLIFTWIIFLFFSLYLLSFTSHAESVYFPMGQDDNYNLLPEMFTSIDNYLDAENNKIFVFYRYYDSNSRRNYAYYISYPKTNNGNLYGEILTNNYQFSLYYSGSGSYTIGEIYWANFDWSHPVVLPNTVSMSSFQNLYSSLYSNTPSYISNFRLYTNNTIDRKVVLNYGSGDEVGTGHATAPINDENNFITDSQGNRIGRPNTPTINNYSWTTYNSPTIDTSTIESLLESLIYVVNYLAGWLSSNISGEFSNLITNIQNLFNFLVQSVENGFNNIVQAIQDFAEDFYNNMVSLFEPIAEKVAYLTEPVDGTIIYDNISTTSLVTNISSINSSLTSFKTSFDSLSEPNSFTIPIHLENLPSAYFGNQTTQYIDLGVLGSTEKAIIRTFMWAIITYSLFITIVDSISNYINGGGDES